LAWTGTLALRALGGGMGRLQRRFRMTIDNLAAVDLVMRRIVAVGAMLLRKAVFLAS